MSIEIHGWIEERSSERWTGLFDLSGLERNYQLFGLLFGVRDYQFEPLAEKRGFPSDICSALQEELLDYPEPNQLQPSWLAWHELASLGLPGGGIRAERLTIEIHRRWADRVERLGTTYRPSQISFSEFRELQRKRVLETTKYIYKAVAASVVIGLSPPWRRAFEAMAKAERANGPGSTRLVAYFE